MRPRRREEAHKQWCQLIAATIDVMTRSISQLRRVYGYSRVAEHDLRPTSKMTLVGFEPTQLALVELESTPLDHSGKVSCHHWAYISDLRGAHQGITPEGKVMYG